MADEHMGQRLESRAPWLRIFSAFKIALDIKNLLLAAGGLLVTALGWWVLAVAFYNGPFASMPRWSSFENEKEPELAWERFKRARHSWNMLHEMAGALPTRDRDPGFVDAADLAQNLAEYKILDEVEQASKKLSGPIRIALSGDGGTLTIEETGKNFKFVTVAEKAKLENAGRLRVRDLTVLPGDPAQAESRLVTVHGATLKVEQGFPDLKKFREEAGTEDAIREKLANATGMTKDRIALFLQHLNRPVAKPAGVLSTLPWFENRGPNPFLFLTTQIKQFGSDSTGKSRYLIWFFGHQAPVLLEPVVKFLKPVAYLFDPRADIYNSLYLVLVLLWTVTTWGFFGGAICRIAAVQACRGEKIPLAEALVFARDKFLSLFLAPVVPLGVLGILAFVLMLFGTAAAVTWFVGDIVFYGLGFPVALVLGLVMGVVLVGLVGWPLMNATVATEGSDAFDAISRSYSYVYQAPWHYLWYCFVAMCYGAVLVFFVGFMASLVVFLAKWSIGLLPWIYSTNLDWNRDPTYLFLNAPTSFQWRDLLISGSPSAKVAFDADPSGTAIATYTLSPEFLARVSWSNSIGSFLVSIWLYVFFLLIVGFGYSYFWSVCTIIYTLMRKQVDETDLDEVHMEEDMANPFTAPPPPQAPAPAAPKANTVSLQTVEAPTPAPTAPATSPPVATTAPPIVPAPTPAPAAPTTSEGTEKPASTEPSK